MQSSRDLEKASVYTLIRSGKTCDFARVHAAFHLEIFEFAHEA